jgi:hypothetical protein
LTVGISLTGPGALSRAQLTFYDQTPQTLTFTAPRITANSTLTLPLSGGAAAQFVAPAPLVFSSYPATQMTVTCNPSTPNIHAGTSTTCTLSPNGPPLNGDLEVTLVTTGGGGGYLSTNVLVFSTDTPLTFQFTASIPSGPNQIAFVLGGDDGPGFTAPDNLGFASYSDNDVSVICLPGPVRLQPLE